MPSLRIAVLAILFAASTGLAQEKEPGPPSTQPGAAPKGQVTKYTFDQSRIFPGTVRDYWVYVPRQYNPAQPACVWVNQDGVQFNAPAVFDRLINDKEMPVTVGIFVMHGRVKAPAEHELDRFNRSFEYDGLGDNYARFILDELLPHIAKEQKLNLSTDGNDRGIGGSSSGAVCAFTAAWERPDAFRRIFSSIGTYVGLRGANRYPTLIRKYEPKPLRVFLQDGSSDLNIYGGDWWMANQEMERALTFAGYEVNHIWGEGGHNGKQATEIFPEAMRWLWKDWPAPPKAGAGSQQLKEILLPAEPWKLAADGYKSAASPAANASGETFFCDVPAGKTFKIDVDGKILPFICGDKAIAQAFGPDGRLYAAGPEQVTACDAEGHSAAVAPVQGGRAIVVSHSGAMYVTSLAPDAGGKVWFINAAGDKKEVDSGINDAAGITLSTDQSLLYVADARSHWVFSYQVEADGALKYKQQYYHLHVPDEADDSGAGGMCVDADGRLYVATRMGVQVCDQAGRVNCILPTPNGKVTDVCFGGRNFDTLYATSGDKVFTRKLNVRGVAAWQAPAQPAAPHL